MIALRNEHELSAISCAENSGVCRRSLRERHFATNRRPQGAIPNALQYVRHDCCYGAFSRVPKLQSPDVELFRHRNTGIDRDFATVANDNDAAIRGGKVHVGSEILIRKHFYNKVGPLTASPRPDFIEVARHRVAKSAPSRRMRSKPSGDPALPITRSPARFASCTTDVPTDPLAPWTNTMSPAVAPPR